MAEVALRPFIDAFMSARGDTPYKKPQQNESQFA